MADNEKATYKLTVVGPGLDFSRDVTEGVASMILSAVMSGAGALPESGGGDGSPAGSSAAEDAAVRNTTHGRKPTVGEYLATSGASSNSAKIVAFASYLQLHENVDTFTRDQIRGMFQKARHSPPGNFVRDFNAAIASNWIAEADTSNEFFLTATGTEAVNDHFAGVPKSRRPRKVAAKKGASNKATKA